MSPGDWLVRSQGRWTTIPASEFLRGWRERLALRTSAFAECEWRRLNLLPSYEPMQ